MSKFDYNKIMPRYSAIATIMTLIALAVVGKAIYIMSAKHDYWMKVADRVKKDSVEVIPVRGNILSCDGQLLASSLPEFKVFMDFKTLHDSGTDSLWEVKLDSICQGLHHIFPERSTEEFRSNLEQGRKEQKRHWAVWPKRINYNTYTRVKQLPIFNLSIYKSGFHSEELSSRERPYGNLAGRTLGDMYAAMDEGRRPRCGLELSYDSLLRGTKGYKQHKKVLNKFIDIIDIPPISGADIVTTIDVSMQDLAERTITDKLRELNANVGVVIVMEVQTGDIKAIVNMERCFDGEYREIKNHAVSDLLEPGSVFKTLSVMTLLEDGYCDTTKVVDTESGIHKMYGRDMKDHNWSKGGYGQITLARALEVSSNIGISRVVDEYYHKNPEKFVDGLRRLGINADLGIPIVGSASAKVRRPHRNSHNQYDNWSNTALAWMSIGYETQVPPISTLTVYNAIANGGRMVKPRFVTAAVKDGKVVEDFPVEVVEGYEQIASPSTLEKTTKLLVNVVKIGTGKKAGSHAFDVAGKTGTAQISKGAAGYRSGTMHYLASFAGFFPADKPRYSIIVCIQKAGSESGGTQFGPLVRKLAEGRLAFEFRRKIEDAHDSTSTAIPDVKTGNILSADYVLSQLGIKTNTNFQANAATQKQVWGLTRRDNDQVTLLKQGVPGPKQVPNIMGMGASDAVYLMEKRGVKTRVIGRGKVVEQSLPAGRLIKKGDVCTITLK